MTILSLALIFFGGGFGAVSRHTLTNLPKNKTHWHTSFVNITGAFILGFLLSYTESHHSLSTENLFIKGFCGAFTTFSSFSHENLTLIKGNKIPTALINIVASLGSSIISLFLGIVVANQIY